MTNEQVSSVDTEESAESGCTGVRVLVVDRDSTCLAIVSRMLHAFGYEVITATRAIDALRILQVREDDLDLILTEVHLPDMDKYQLLERLGEISSLPIVVLSADNDENTILGCLFKGAEFYLSKPITMNDVKNLWQFSCLKKQGKKVVPEELRSFGGDSPPDNSSNEVSESQSFSDASEQRSQNGKKRKEVEEEMEEDMEEDNVSLFRPKKRKLIWTNELHDRFLQAIRILGLDSAHPKKILKHMNVPGLKKENISSHLQKYRLSLKREQDAIQRTMLGDYDISPYNLRGETFVFQEQQSLMTSKTEFRSYVQNGSSMSMDSLESTNFPIDVDSNHNDISNPKSAQLAPLNYDMYSTCIKSCSNGEFDPVRNDDMLEFVEQGSTFCGVGEQEQQFLVPPPWEQQEDEIFEEEVGDIDELFDMPTESTDILQDEDANKDIR